MIETFGKLLFMLLATNGAPVLVTRVLQSLGSVPVDLGRRLPDGRPIFGPSKTWRGVIAALATSCILAWCFGYGCRFGFTLGVLVVAGDLISSFIKRRIGIPPSDRFIGLDQLPESVLPSLYAVSALELDWSYTLLLPLAFMLVEMVISKPLFLLKIRKRPH